MAKKKKRSKKRGAGKGKASSGAQAAKHEAQQPQLNLDDPRELYAHELAQIKDFDLRRIG